MVPGRAGSLPSFRGTIPGAGANDYILIGQGCSGSLLISPGEPLDTGIELSNYHWNVPGLTFASFDVAADSGIRHVEPSFLTLPFNIAQLWTAL